MKLYAQLESYFHIAHLNQSIKMTEEEFDERYVKALDAVLEAMAENAEIEPGRFYGVACIIENLRFFSPVLYAAIQKK